MCQSETPLAVLLLAEDALRSLEVNDSLAVGMLAAMNILGLNE
jgi:hypothetical protein